MNASAIAAFALFLSAPAPPADVARSPAIAGKAAPAAAEAKATTGSTSASPAGGIECREEYRSGGTVVLVGGLGGQRPLLLPATAAPGGLLLPELGSTIGAVPSFFNPYPKLVGANGEVPDVFHASRCSFGMIEREAAECLE